MGNTDSKLDSFKALTWEDVQDWAGMSIVSRGKSYQQNGRVSDVSRTPDGGIVAWVRGAERYATMVDIVKGELTSSCTCPYWTTCKHAVAVTLEYLNQIKSNIEVPGVTGDDRRLMLLDDAAQDDWDDENDEDDWDDENDEEDEEDEDDEDDEDEVLAVSPASRRSAKPAETDILAFLKRQTKAKLIDLIEELADRHPVVRETLQNRQRASANPVTALVDSIREEIAEVSEEPGWQNHWDHGGYIPDYSRVRDQLEILLKRGFADEVVSLGEELLEAGVQQVEMSGDEGETQEEIASCMDIVFRALSRTSRSPVDRMLWAIDAEIADDYELCSGASVFWEHPHPVEAWNALAAALTDRLAQDDVEPGNDDFHMNYRRNQLSDRLIHALEQAGRQDEVIPLCEREAEKTGHYTRLIGYLKIAERWDEMEQWIHKGIQATQEKWPGIAEQLRDALITLREQQGDWLAVAGYQADRFFSNPSVSVFQALEKAAEKAEVWPAVRAVIMEYLETGKLPESGSGPLPEIDMTGMTDRRQMSFPMIDILIQIAIAEEQPNEVIRWYDRRTPEVLGWGRFHQDEHVAEAVAERYPDRAIAIWKKTAEGLIKQTQVKSYESAFHYLRKIHRVLNQHDREEEWLTYLADIRQANSRKWRLMEILDTLTEQRIID